jgi:hypothetical protein
VSSAPQAVLAVASSEPSESSDTTDAARRSGVLNAA